MAQARSNASASTAQNLEPAAASEDKEARDDTLVLRELYNDHRNIGKTLGAYEDQLNLYQSGNSVDLHLMHDVMSYLVLNPDQYHHPLEDTFFALIAKKDIALKEEVDKTTNEHTLLKDAGEAVLECLADQLRSPTSLKESHVVLRSETYITLLKGHIDREETLLFRPGSKLLSRRDWRELADILRSNPDDPLFDDEAGSHYLTLREYLQERFEDAADKLAEQEYLQMDNLIDGIDTLSSSASEIGDIIGHHSKDAWQETRDSFRELLDSDRPKLKAWLSTPLSCSLNGLDHYVSSLSEISQVLHGAQKSLEQESSNKKTRAKKKGS